MYKWWAQYAESCGNAAEALQYYKLSEETAAVVRMLCILGRVQEGEALAQETDDRAAFYVLGEHFEGESNVRHLNLSLFFYTYTDSLACHSV